jgi:hypothetical protein
MACGGERMICQQSKQGTAAAGAGHAFDLQQNASGWQAEIE